jgi:hypothetical protein
MLASTVQFSNNDQPPITPNQPVRVHWGRHQKDSLSAAPSDTQQRARPSQLMYLRSTPKQYLQTHRT